MILKIKKAKDVYPELIKIPKYETKNASCFDVRVIEDVVLYPGEIKPIRTGLFFEIPIGYEMQVRQRSGISSKFPNYIANAPGTIDADYRGELFILTVNNTKKPWNIEMDTRFAQCKISKSEQFGIIETKELSETERGSGGFGHTGLK
jgi:dUTP pyrophosphatase